MSTITTRLFGTLSVEADGVYQSTETVIGGRRLERSLFINVPFEDALFARITAMLDAIEDLDARARRAIAEDASTIVADYVSFHVEEVAALAGLEHEAFLKRLELVGLGVHPASTGDFSLVLDYSPGRELVDGVLAVKFDSNGELLAIDHES